MKIIAVIPARYESSRLPGKPLADINGQPMVVRVYKNTVKVKLFNQVLVATDDERIANVCKENNMNYIMTSSSHQNCTYRLYEVAQKINADLYISVNGDEPLVSADDITLIVEEAIKQYPNFTFGYRYLTDPAEVFDSSNIKIVTNKESRCLYLSRTPIPFPYKRIDFQYKKSVGIECYSKESLDFFVNTAPGNLETIEDLTFLRFLENNKSIYAKKINSFSLSVDTYKDLEKVRKIFEKKENS